jgi:hypothetical protein
MLQPLARPAPFDEAAAKTFAERIADPLSCGAVLRSIAQPILPSAGRLILAGATLLALSAAAEAHIRYISATGKNANDCKTPRTACRNLQKGIDVTPMGGELRILDSAFYGNGTIDKSITIAADNATVFLKDAPLVIDNHSAVVTLRGISLNGRGRIAAGITVKAAAAVHIENCTIERFTTFGIVSPAARVKLFLAGSVVRDNLGTGLFVTPSQGVARLMVDDVRVENNAGDGVDLHFVRGSFTRSMISSNAGDGIKIRDGRIHITSTTSTENGGSGYAIRTQSDVAVVILKSSAAHDNGDRGLLTSGVGTFVTISKFVSTENQVGITNSGGIASCQNNLIKFNGKFLEGPPMAICKGN